MKKICLPEKKQIANLAASFCLPAFIMLICLFLIDATPFGNNSLIFRDANGQYLDFLSYTKTILSGENDLFYSFAKGMGGSLIGLAAYYMLSPFNLLFIFASNGSIVLMFEIVVILKIACSGMLFYYASSKLYGAKPALIMFSCAYALMAYNIVYEWNIMWLDGPMMLPMLWLGIYKIWTERKYLLYTVSLIYCLFSNYYIGFMLCIASVIFSVSMMILSENMDKGEKIKVFAKYLLSSMIAGFSTAFIWLPAFISLLSDRAAFKSSNISFEINFMPMDIFSKLGAGAISPNDLQSGLPNIFCTSLVVLLVLMFFMNNAFSARKRLTALCCLAILLLSFNVKLFNVVWHGFSPPNGFNYRYSFIFSFIMVMLAQNQFILSEKNISRHVFISAFLLSAALIVTLTVDYDHTSTVGTVLSIICTLMIFLLLMQHRLSKRSISLMLTAICVFEAAANASITLKRMTVDVGSMKMGNHYETIQSSETALEYIRKIDAGFYRTEKKFRRSHNDPMFYNYNGLTHFSSADKKFVMEFLEKMGLRNNDIWAYFNNGTTNEAEAFLGIKYIIGGDDISKYKNYEIIHDTGETRIYRNENSLSPVFLSNKDILRLSMEKEDLFELHNDIWTAISGTEQNVLIPEENFNIKLNNLSSVINGDGDTVYTRIDSEKDASVCYEITVTENKPLYYYFTAPLVQAANISVNDNNEGRYFWIYRWDMSSAGRFEPGETVKLEIVLKANELIVSDEFFYYEDLDKLAEAANKINAQDTKLIREKSSRLSGSFNAEENCMLLFTIPYDDGWTLKVDGKNTELVKVMDTLMAAEVEAGEHEYTLSFCPVGFKCGMYMAVAALITAAIWYLTERKKR